MKQAKTIIIGAGPTGLSVAYHLNGSSIVIESADCVGGLCRSFKVKDVIFDIGGHSLHTMYEKVRAFISEDLGVKLFFQKRDARILFKNSIIPYPWQSYFHLIKDKKISEDCHAGLQTRKHLGKPMNLHELILSKYGDGIAQHFLFPYNKKLWLRNLDEISCLWASERIADLKNESALGSKYSAKRTPLHENSIVGYPSEGGFDEIFKKMAAKISNIRLGQHVCFIDPHRKVLMTKQAKVFKWERIVSTMPIPDLIGMLKNAPRNVVRLAHQLQFVSLQLGFFVMSEPLHGVPQRLYCADAEFPAHKITFNSLSSENERKKHYHSIIAETSVNDECMDCCHDRTARILKGLSDAKIIKGQPQIMMHRYEFVKYAYPVQCHQVKHIIDSLSRYLESQGIYSVGRFGKWQYINSDECLLKGAELAKRLDSKAQRTQMA